MSINHKKEKGIALIALIGGAAAWFVIQNVKGQGKLIKPVTGKVTSEFGTRIHPKTGVKQFHNGLDIAVPIGTPVFAPNDSVVSALVKNDAGGNQLVIRLKNGDVIGFAHLSKYNVKKLQNVKKGDIIAFSGNTGTHTTGAHVHLTVRNNSGEFINPKKYFGY